MRPQREGQRPRHHPTGRERRGRVDATPFVLAMGIVVAAGTVFVAWTALAGGVNVDLDLDWDSFRPAEEEAPVATRTPGPTEVVTPSPTPGLPAVSGSPFSLSSLENAWKAKGMTLFSEGGSAGFSGTAVTPSAVRAQRGTETAQLAVLIYPSSAVVKQDWNLSSGQAPSPVGGRTVPANESVWWNQNVVVVLLSGSAAVGNDVKAAFLAL